MTGLTIGAVVGIIVIVSVVFGAVCYLRNKNNSAPVVHKDEHTTVDADGNEFFDGYKVYDYTGVEFEDVNVYLN